MTFQGPATGAPGGGASLGTEGPRSVYRTPTRPHWHRPGKNGWRCSIAASTSEVALAVALMRAAMHSAQYAVPPCSLNHWRTRLSNVGSAICAQAPDRLQA